MKVLSPKMLLHLEGGIVLVAACVAYHQLGASWWMFAGLFLAPDLFMLGYLVRLDLGAVVYNLGHTYVTPLILFLSAYAARQSGLLTISTIWVAHIGFDRLLGYRSLDW